MKKRDEGYALLLVVVVIVVLSIVSAALMSLGLSNLKSQKASIERMTDKYTAQGQIEIIVAKLSQEAKLTLQDPNQFNNDLAKADLTQWLQTTYGVEPQDVDIVQEDKDGSLQYTSCSYTIVDTAQEGTAAISYKIKFTCSLTKEESSGYVLKTTDISYQTYDISTVETSEGGGG